MKISFTEIPGQSPLYLDYLYNFKKTAKYYIKDFRNEAIYEPHFKDVLSKHPTDRKLVTQAIKNQYISKRISTKTSQNIKLLEEKNTLAIVTGQQLGVVGGPLYTIYKTITAIKLANSLSQKYPDYNFVPIFWLAGDDHDFEEISSVNIINNDNKVQKISYNLNDDTEREPGSVGGMVLGENIEDFIASLSDSLRPTEFTQDIIGYLGTIYQKGKTITEAFSEMMFKFFDKYGLLIFNPQAEDVKKLLIPIFRQEIENYRVHATKLISVSAGLDEEYHAQVKIRPINIFVNNENGRYLLDPLENNEFRLKRKKVKFSKEDLLQLLESSPEMFSPNVLLRPICQDYLFATAFYVGGPAEIAYYAQITQLYKAFNLATPIAYPRMSATIVEKSVQALTQKYDLTVNDYFELKKEIFNKVASKISEFDIEGKFEVSENRISNIFDDIKEYLTEIDKTLSEPVEKSKLRTLQYMSELKGKAESARLRKHESTLNQLQKSYTMILPNENLQERELNYFYFANKYGLGFYEYLMEKLDLHETDHQIVML
jgi:bacillithiol biosynthesis cysteine-adding enzyme BshC